MAKVLNASAANFFLLFIISNKKANRFFICFKLVLNRTQSPIFWPSQVFISVSLWQRPGSLCVLAQDIGGPHLGQKYHQPNWSCLHVVIGKWAYLWQRQGSAHTVPWPGSPWPDQSCSAGSGCASASWSPQLPSVPMSVAADRTRCQLWTQMHNTNYPSHQVKTTTKNFLNKRKRSDVAHVFKMGATLFRPWATVCGWQDVKPQELTFHLRNAPLWSNTKRTNLKISFRYQFPPLPPPSMHSSHKCLLHWPISNKAASITAAPFSMVAIRMSWPGQSTKDTCLKNKEKWNSE